MSNHTSIHWCDSTVNATTGCDGCELWKLIDPERDLYGGPCYAGPIHEQRLARSFPDLYAANFTEVRLAPGRMAAAAAWSDLRGKPRPGKPWLDGLPRLIFVGDMGDALSKVVPFDYFENEILAAAASPKGRRHIWLFLTKQARRAAELSRQVGDRWPSNFWLGTSITTRATLSRARDLRTHTQSPLFLSLEPLWERVDLVKAGLLYPYEVSRDDQGNDLGSAGGGSDFSWVIVGGQSDQRNYPAKPFDIDWARQVVRDCEASAVSCHVKQLGSRPYDSAQRISIDGPDSHAVELSLGDRDGGDWSEWPADLRVRQFPGVPV